MEAEAITAVPRLRIDWFSSGFSPRRAHTEPWAEDCNRHSLVGFRSQVDWSF